MHDNAGTSTTADQRPGSPCGAQQIVTLHQGVHGRRHAAQHHREEVPARQRHAHHGARINDIRLSSARIDGACVNDGRTNGARVTNDARVANVRTNGARVNGACVTNARLSGARVTNAHTNEARLNDGDAAT